jgi:hypothetical protein
MVDVKNIMLPICKNENSKANILNEPPNCTAGRSLKYLDEHSSYRGKFKNVSNGIIPESAVSPLSSKATMDLTTITIPSEWSWKNSGGDKIENGSRNQGTCGCCWAIALVSVLGDRYALKYNIKAPYPSSIQLVSCGAPNIGINSPNGGVRAQDQCDCGSNPWAGSLWLEQGGEIGLESCWPFSVANDNGTYIAPNCPNFNSNCCHDCCDNPNSVPKFSVAPGSTKYLVVADDNNVVNVQATINSIKKDIMEKGPVVTTFWVPNDFQEWWTYNAGTTNIYKPSTSFRIGTNGHTVVLSGWGNENGVDYWEMRNSWGNPGFCRFAMATSLDKSQWTGIDIPTWISEQRNWSGGVISMDPGPLTTTHPWVKGDTNIVAKAYTKTIDFRKILIVSTIIICIFLSLILFYKYMKS